MAEGQANGIAQGPPVAWCTNVHDAHTIDDLCAALRNVSAAIDQTASDVDRGVGLWLPPDMVGSRQMETLRSTLADCNLKCIGLNAFPAMAFHGNVVKDTVYRPAWDDPKRLQYTRRCTKALLELLEPDSSAGLTTVPLGWPAHGVDVEAAAGQIRIFCTELDRIGHTMGIDLHLAIEPEPGCLLDTAAALADFVRQHNLLDLAATGRLRACLDVCHLAVMHESPDEALDALASSHIAVGRVQISSAVEADMQQGTVVRESLAALDEPKWMHQTTCMVEGDRQDWPDLPEALANGADGLWRTHLHVPVHLQSIGPLGTTQRTIIKMLSALHKRDLHPPLEVETYAWNVLPDSIRQSDLPTNIARELLWTRDAARAQGWT